jgi:hypothetical protein
MMMHAGNVNPNAMHARINSMLASGFPMMPTQPAIYPWICNQPMMAQILGVGPNVSDPSLNFCSASDLEPFFVPSKSTAQDRESGQNYDTSSNLETPASAVESNSIAPKL